MLIDSNDYHNRVNGAPIFYGAHSPALHTSPVSAYYSYYPPEVSPPYMNYDFLMSKLTTQNLPLTLTPPTSPPLLVVEQQQTRRSSVIMKVENCQIVSSDDASEQQICRWEKCYRNFESLEKLANHVSMSHSQVGFNNLYYCKWEGCQRSTRGFNARYKMLVHCRTHTKEKPHFCTFVSEDGKKCCKAFSRAENLKIHYRSHTLEKPYRCCYPNCQKAYSNSSDRFKHSKTHMNNKPYCCKVLNCSKRYTDPSSLRKHVKTFNHDIITLNVKSVESSDEPMICETKEDSITTIHSPQSQMYYGTIGFKDHSTSNDDQLFYVTKHVEITDKMETIRLDQPLDLRVHHKR